jgi:hypothetical protein
LYRTLKRTKLTPDGPLSVVVPTIEGTPLTSVIVDIRGVESDPGVLSNGCVIAIEGAPPSYVNVVFTIAVLFPAASTGFTCTLYTVPVTYTGAELENVQSSVNASNGAFTALALNHTSL